MPLCIVIQTLYRIVAYQTNYSSLSKDFCINGIPEGLVLGPSFFIEGISEACFSSIVQSYSVVSQQSIFCKCPVCVNCSFFHPIVSICTVCVCGS